MRTKTQDRNSAGDIVKTMGKRLSDRERHKVFTRALRNVEPGESLAIPKSRLDSLPASYQPTILGYPVDPSAPGARSQYRGPYRRHVYESRRAWVVHKDRVDPREDPIGHLLEDAPELAAAVGVGALVGYAVGKQKFDKRLGEGAAHRDAVVDAALASALWGIGAGAVAFGITRLLKDL